MYIHFVFIGEGTSDDGLLNHIENLCIEAGASEVTGTCPDFRRLGESIGHSVESKLKAALKLEPQANLFLVHRDADNRSPQTRHNEISQAVAAINCKKRVISIVPTQETEAWLLLDEDSIRRTVGRPNGSVALNLPNPTQVENISKPKEKLRYALEMAAEVRGRRLDRVRKDFSRYRRALLQDLPTSGAIENVPSWLRFRDEIRVAVTGLRLTN